MKRRTDGTFLPQGEPLSSKFIGLRISESRINKFKELAAVQNLSLAELARAIIHRYVDESEINKVNPEESEAA